MTPQVYIAGQPVAALAPVGDMVIAHEWPDAGVGGPESAEFSISLPPARRPGWLVRDASADVRFGGSFVLAGQVSEVDWVEGKIAITAAAREGATTACLTAAGLTSTTPDTVIDAAISRGASTWSRPASISTTPLTAGDQTATLNNLADLLGSYADEAGARLYVDPYRQILKTTGGDPTVPSFFLTPGAGELSWTAEAQATRVIGGWHDASGAPNVTAVGSGAIEKLVDLDPKGPLTLARATAILNSLLAAATAGGWTGGLTVTSEQIFGRPHLAAVADAVGRGCMVRLLGQRDPRPGWLPVGYVDVVIERSEWNVAEGTITLTPRGMVDRDWSTIVTDAGLEDAA